MKYVPENACSAFFPVANMTEALFMCWYLASQLMQQFYWVRVRALCPFLVSVIMRNQQLIEQSCSTRWFLHLILFAQIKRLMCCRVKTELVGEFITN